MVEIDIDFCLGIRLYGLPRKQNVDFFSCGQHSKNNFSALKQGHRNGIERIQGWFLNTGQNGKLYFAFCHTWRHAGVKASLWIYSVCVCALQSWISLFGADPLQVSGFLALDILGTILVWWASLKHVVMVNATKWGYFIEHKPGTSVHTLLDCFNTLAVDSTIYGMFC